MYKKRVIVIVSALIFLGLVGFAAWHFYYKKNIGGSISQNETQTGTNSLPPSTQQPKTPKSVATLYYPMTSFDNRITFRSFGQLVKSTDVASPCGAHFSGYHDADDLEVTPAEVGAEVPVYAIADGVVKEASIVSGYGGLLVLGVVIKGQNYTVYYGHINLGSTTLVAGGSVKAGQRLANLGEQCSSQTGGERKHLHFAIHRGVSIDVRGYVPSLGDLAAWVDPKVFLVNNLAAPIQ